MRLFLQRIHTASTAHVTQGWGFASGGVWPIREQQGRRRGSYRYVRCARLDSILIYQICQGEYVFRVHRILTESKPSTVAIWLVEGNLVFRVLCLSSAQLIPAEC